MLGYIQPDKPELKIREFELYKAYYCGICKSVKNRYGQIPRLVLSYDAVFLALILGAVGSKEGKIEKIKQERCPVHPIKKRPIVYDETAIDYAADMMLILAYFKLLDDKQDEGGIKASAGLLAMKNTYKKLMKIHGEKCIIVKDRLKELAKLEKEKCPSLDRAAEPFAQLLGEIFAADAFAKKPGKLEQLRRIGYHTGKWIYLIDAFDDIEDNAISGSYNPLIHQWNYKAKEESLIEFCKRIQDRTEFNLHYYLTELSRMWDGLEAVRNQELVENIIYSGLLRKTEEILSKGKTEDAKPL